MGRTLFARQGYSQTSMVEIAEAAGVSVQTIYDSVGSKAALVLALNDLIDEEGDVAALVRRIPDLEDPSELLQIPISINRNIGERCQDILDALFSGAAIEPELAKLRAESLRRHRSGCGRVAARLEQLGALRPGLDLEEAGDVIAALSSPQVSRLFVVEYGWDWPRWDRWTQDALGRQVLS